MLVNDLLVRGVLAPSRRRGGRGCCPEGGEPGMVPRGPPNGQTGIGGDVLMDSPSSIPGRAVRVLVVEDDPEFRSALRTVLRMKGYLVIESETLAGGRRAVDHDVPDVILLDRDLPDGDGRDLCRDLRMAGCRLPIVLLTGATELDSQVLGLESGADEYWTKPIPARLLESRMAALVRRCYPPSPDDRSELRLFGIAFDFRRCRALREGREMDFTRREFELLEALWRAEGAPLSREDLLARVWKYEHVPHSRTVDNHVLSLRKKIEPDPGNPVALQTVARRGYRLVVPGSGDPPGAAFDPT